MKKTLILLGVLALILPSCSDRDDTVTTQETTTSTTTTTTPTTPTKQEAKVSITASGRTTYQNIYIMVGSQSGTAFVENERQVLPSNGKITLDLSKYIGQVKRIKAVEIKNNTIKDVSSVRQITVKANTTQSVSLAISAEETKKVYDANITVRKNGTAQQGVKVYALTNMQSVLKALISTTGSTAVKDVVNATTDANGVAKFTNLANSDIINGKYEFVVITREPNIVAGISGKYESVSLTLDGTKAGTGTINITE